MATKKTRKADAPERGPGYERRDASIRGLIQFAFWMAVVLAVTLVGMKWMFDYFKKAQPLGATTSPLVKEGERPPLPGLLLQVRPRQELVDYCTAQQAAVNSYGWVNQESGAVRVPVDRAMDLVLSRGLPTRAAAEAPPGAPAVPPPDVSGDTDVQGQCGYLTEPKETVKSEAAEAK